MLCCVCVYVCFCTEQAREVTEQMAITSTRNPRDRTEKYHVISHFFGHANSWCPAVAEHHQRHTPYTHKQLITMIITSTAIRGQHTPNLVHSHFILLRRMCTADVHCCARTGILQVRNVWQRIGETSAARRPNWNEEPIGCNFIMYRMLQLASHYH